MGFFPCRDSSNQGTRHSHVQTFVEVKLSQAGPIDFFTPIDHLPRPSGIMVGLSAYGVAALVLHIRTKLTSLWEPSTSLCVTH